MWKCIVFAALIALAIGRHSYSGYQVIKVFGSTEEDFKFIERYEEPKKLVVWDYELGDDTRPIALVFHVHPDLADDLKDQIVKRGLQYTVHVHDLQKHIDTETEANIEAQSKLDDAWFDSYHTYIEIMNWIDDRAAACGSRCSTFSIGNSYQGRELKVLKITGAPNSCTQKPTIWIDAGIHAREWISHTTNMYIIDKLIEEYDTVPFVKQMRDTYDWYFLPIVNPDGYAYTWSTDRMWRKTRQPVSGSTCVGADANRNFDHMWMTIGASNNPCSETYAGPAAYSEPEAKAVADFMMTMNGTWELFITLHTYGQLWMAPWGYTKDLPDDYNELTRVGQAAVRTILDTHGKAYEMGNAASILYESSGTSRDWAKGIPKVPYVFTIELRSTNSFVLPPAEIRPTGQEIWAALKTTIERIQDVRPGFCISMRT